MISVALDGGGGVVRVGDIVRLTCGGPPMAVVAVHDDLVTCCWFESLPDGGWKGAGRETFPAAVLERTRTDG